MGRRQCVPRRRRIILPNSPHHIVQRGHNKHAVFIEREYYQYYLDNLVEWKQELQIKVYSYCLMTHHRHLIVDPGEYPSNVGDLMKRLAARQTRYVNKLEKRTGSNRFIDEVENRLGIRVEYRGQGSPVKVDKSIK